MKQKKLTKIEQNNIFNYVHCYVYNMDMQKALRFLLHGLYDEAALPTPVGDKLYRDCLLDFVNRTHADREFLESFLRWLMMRLCLYEANTCDMHELCFIVSANQGDPIGISCESTGSINIELEMHGSPNTIGSYYIELSVLGKKTRFTGKNFITALVKALQAFVKAVAKYVVVDEPCDLEDAIRICHYAATSKHLKKNQRDNLRKLQLALNGMFTLS